MMTLKIGFVGIGGIARAHMNHLAVMEGVTVSAFTSKHLVNAEKAAAQWSDARAYPSVADMLDDRKLDAVYVCVPPSAHNEIDMQVAERGIPFLVEKPLGMEWELPRKIAEMVQDKSLITSVGYQWRYLDSVQKAKELTQGAHIGMALGFWMGTMPTTAWWVSHKDSGGQFVEQTTHITDLLRYFCGEVTEVYAAFGKRAMHEMVEGADVSDVGTVTMKMADGSVATISNTCLIPTYHHVGLDIYTAEGIYEIREKCLKVSQGATICEYINQSQALYNENAAFIHAVRTGDTSRILSDYADSLKTYEVTMAANESARTGKPVQIRPLT
jgi:myo-inositol 2-dehydrogenase/D-chiro-inositol 1-dehydrogenase